MATNATSTSDSSTDSTETDEQGTNSTEEQDTEETSGQSADGTESQEQAPAPKPDDKKDPAKQALLADLHKERKALKASSTELTALKSEVAELRPVKETLDAVQAKYDRLEEFLQAAGGTLGKALDSRTFTKALFETDEDIAAIVKKWNVANPSATSTALGSQGANPAPKGPDMNSLLRSALK